MKRRTTILAMLAACASAAAAPPPITITGAWMRALPGGLPAGGYFVLHNQGSAPLALTGASSPACGMLMLHKSDSMSGMAKMEDITHIDVPAGGTLNFAPGGYHLMCMNPTAAMKPGGKVSVTLQFAGGASLTTPFNVRNAAGH